VKHVVLSEKQVPVLLKDNAVNSRIVSNIDGYLFRMAGWAVLGFPASALSTFKEHIQLQMFLNQQKSCIEFYRQLFMQRAPLLHGETRKNRAGLAPILSLMLFTFAVSVLLNLVRKADHLILVQIQVVPIGLTQDFIYPEPKVIWNQFIRSYFI
jgi:hypothetical protein